MAFQSRLFGQEQIFQQIRESFHELPHLFITGPPGSGKTTFLEDFVTLCKKEAPFKLENVLWLSSEKDRGIHTIRDKVHDFCKRSHKGSNMLRWILVDDADTLPLISQQALRRPMEQYFHLTRFIFASRHTNNLIEPLRSRCLHLELEPISPFDALPLYMKQYTIPEQHTKELFDFCVRNFITINEMKSILRLFSSYLKENTSKEEIFQKLHCLLPMSNKFMCKLIQALGEKKENNIRSAITDLFQHGYLLDDILLGIEKGISIYPSTDPNVRFRILQFTMLGWISIQQGKEHWLDTMDILATTLKDDKE
jgi:DNA polymerase III delta prime subunit